MTAEPARKTTTAGLAARSIPQAFDARRTTRIVLIELHVWFRDCLAHALISFLPDVSVEGADSVEEVVPGPAGLLLIGIHPWFQSAQLRDAIDMLRRVGDGSPVGAYLHADNGALARLTARLGVAGIVMPDAGVEIAIASVRVMVAGGNFLPPEAAEAAPDEPLGQAPTQGSRAAESLTSREFEVLQLLGVGRTNKGIAADLSISQSTVKVHLRRMMKKLGTTNRTEAALQLTRRAQPQVGAD